MTLLKNIPLFLVNIAIMEFILFSIHLDTPGNFICNNAGNLYSFHL